MNPSTASAETSNPDTYCQGKAAPEGSNLYYACLFERDENKPRVMAIHALLQELNDILIECSDPGVARMKYQWWLEELERLRQQQARHPVSRYLQATTNPDITMLTGAVMAYEQLLMLDQPATLEESLGLFKRSAGQLWRFCALQAGIHDDVALANTEDLAASYSLLQALQQPNTFITEATCIVPRDTLPVSELMGITDNDAPELLAPFSDLVEQVIRHLDSAYAARDTRQQKYFRHGLILNRIARHTAREIRRADSPLLTMRIGLTPIRKLLLAWWINLSLR